jgi:hypothetical protein
MARVAGSSSPIQAGWPNGTRQPRIKRYPFRPVPVFPTRLPSPRYLAKKRTEALPTKDGKNRRVLRTISDARDYMLTLEYTLPARRFAPIPIPIGLVTN